MNSTNTANRNITALYCRLSKDDDNNGESNSIIHQKEMLLSYAQRNGFINTEFYVDDGYTGTNFDRPDFKRMMCDIEDGRVKTVIVKDMSRFGREYIQVGMYTELIFPEKGIRFIAVNDGEDSDKGSSDFTPFRNIINEWYAKDISKKIKSVIRSKGTSGKSLVTTPPFGYLFDENDSNIWIIDERAAAIIRRIFTEFVSGKTVSDIRRGLIKDKIPSPMSYKRLYTLKDKHTDIPNDALYNWSVGSITRIIDSPIYIGKAVNFVTTSPSFKSKKRVFTDPSQQVVVDNHHDPIIDQELWEAVRSVRERCRRKYTKYGNLPLFSGYLFCADCGAKMSYMNSVGNKGSGYVCSTYRKRKEEKCSSHYIMSHIIENLVLEKMRSVTDFVRNSEEEFLSIAYKASESVSKREKKSVGSLMSKAQKRENELNTLLSALYEDKVAGNITIEVFNRLSEKYLTEQHQLEEKIQELTERIEKLTKTKADTDSFVSIVKNYTEISSVTSEVLAMFVDKILIHKAEIIDGKRTVKVDVYFKGVGNVDLH